MVRIGMFSLKFTALYNGVTENLGQIHLENFVLQAYNQFINSQNTDKSCRGTILFVISELVDWKSSSRFS